LACGCRDIERYGFFAAVRAEVIRRFVRIAAVTILQIRRAPVARVVAAPRPLDLDDLCSEVGQELAAPWPGQHAAHVEHAYAGERPGRAALRDLRHDCRDSRRK